MWIENTLCGQKLDIIIKSGAPAPGNKCGTIEYCFRQIQTIVVLCGQKIHHVGRKYIMWIENTLCGKKILHVDRKYDDIN